MQRAVEIVCHATRMGQIVTVEADPRGESDTYTAFSLVCREPNGRVVWSEGIRKDRSAMWPEWRDPIEAALATLNDTA